EQRFQSADRKEPGDPASAGQELDGIGSGLADDAAGRLALRQRPAMWACCELGKISRRRSGLSRLRAGGDDPWRLRLRQGIPCRTLFAGIADPAHRADQPAIDLELHRRKGTGSTEVVLRE